MESRRKDPGGQVATDPAADSRHREEQSPRIDGYAHFCGQDRRRRHAGSNIGLSPDTFHRQAKQEMDHRGVAGTDDRRDISDIYLVPCRKGGYQPVDIRSHQVLELGDALLLRSHYPCGDFATINRLRIEARLRIHRTHRNSVHQVRDHSGRPNVHNGHEVSFRCIAALDIHDLDHVPAPADRGGHLEIIRPKHSWQLPDHLETGIIHNGVRCFLDAVPSSLNRQLPPLPRSAHRFSHGACLSRGQFEPFSTASLSVALSQKAGVK